MKTCIKLFVVAVISLALTLSAYASDWSGGTGFWSSNGSPGWNGTGAPNGIGALANFPDAATADSTTVQDQNVGAGGVIVGTASFTGTGNFSRNLRLEGDLVFNQDGAGAGFATISNSNPTVGTGNFMTFSKGSNAGNLVLADDLHIVNTSGNANTSGSGAINIDAVMVGTGNLTISSVANTVTSATNFPGAVGFTRSNTFTGTVLIQKGAVTFSNDPFNSAAAGNIVTLGQAGQGSVTLMSTTFSAMMNNPVVVASGTGGTVTMGTAATTNNTQTGSITLNGNLIVNSFATNNTGLTLSGLISGVGGLTIASGAASPNSTGVTLNHTGGNTYQGGTNINTGIFIANGDGMLGTGFVNLNGPGVTLMLQNGVTQNYIADNASVFTLSTDTLNLNFTGTDTVGALFINGVAQAPGTYNATTNPGLITGTGAFNVLGIPEPHTFALIAFGSLAVLGLKRGGSRGQSLIT